MGRILAHTAAIRGWFWGWISRGRCDWHGHSQMDQSENGLTHSRMVVEVSI